MTLRGSLVATGLVIAVALALIAFGFTWPFVIGWSMLAGAAALLAQLAIPVEPGSDAPHIAAERERRPTEISRMSWALNTHTGLAGQQITKRVRDILRHRLLRRGVDPDDAAHREAAAALLGPDLWARLTGPRTTIADIEHALDAIDRLAPDRTPPPPRSRS
ncbi:hypothetical protein HWD99_15585 [Microbacterium sp. C5A9]|uniref:hypothetical protein n=1 Tax=Microbacterium sp. C5A9 TaxID=2736663 RepID=UPI001F5294B8|nr:hypothetical protein [Microbacterium sp. C5A9]MCI1020050.1 hypothetical protein [Microbacterium sp. C5A9]